MFYELSIIICIVLELLIALELNGMNIQLSYAMH